MTATNLSASPGEHQQNLAPVARISFFASVRDTINSQCITIDELVRMIREPSGDVAAKISRARQRLEAGDKDGFDAAKRSLPAVTMSGTFFTRKAGSLEDHSGLLSVDLDKLDPKQMESAWGKIVSDPHTRLAFKSPSGRGIKAAVRIRPAKDGEEHTRAFLAAKRYFREVHRLELDSSGRDVCRLCFLSHDPDAFTHEGASELDTDQWKVAPDPLPTPDPPPKRGEDPYDDIPPADAGRAMTFVDRFETDIRYIPEKRQWLTWFSDRWRVDSDGDCVRRSIGLSLELMEKAANDFPGTDKASAKLREAAMNDAAAFGTLRKITDLLALAAVDQRILLPAENLDADPWLIGAKNAVIDLRTGEVRPYSRKDYITRTLGCDVVKDAACPRWERFMDEVFPDAEVRRYVWKASGYSLSGSVGEKAFFFLHGSGNNGKSKFIEALEYVFGGLATRAGKAIFIENSRGDYPKHEVAKLQGARVAFGPETGDGERFSETIIKDVTGGDRLTGEFKYQNPFDFSATCKLWLAGNHKPTIRGTDRAIWSRVRLIPFSRVFDGESADRNLGDTLRAEACGILNWLIQGCLLWQRDGLTPPPAVLAAVNDYRADEDTLADFIGACIQEEAGQCVPHGEVYRAYQQWATESGMRFPTTSKRLAKQLRERGWRDGFDSRKSKVWLGIQLSEAG